MNEEIDIFYYFIPMRREVYTYSKNKGKIVGSGTTGKSHNPIVELL